MVMLINLWLSLDKSGEHEGRRLTNNDWIRVHTNVTFWLSNVLFEEASVRFNASIHHNWVESAFSDLVTLLTTRCLTDRFGR